MKRYPQIRFLSVILLFALAGIASSIASPTVTAQDTGESIGLASDTVSCMAVNGSDALPQDRVAEDSRTIDDTAEVELHWLGSATSARLILSVAGSEAAHSVLVNGQSAGTIPVVATSGNSGACGEGEVVYLPLSPNLLNNGMNTIQITSDAAPGDAWTASFVRLEVSGAIAPVSARNRAGGAPQKSTISFTNAYDGTTQQARMQIPSAYTGSATPLIVIVHSRSNDMYWGEQNGFATEAEKRGWLYVGPQLHGRWVGDSVDPVPDPPGKYAYASPEAQWDTYASIQYVIDHYNVDPNRIYLYGISMGGQTGNMVVAKFPDLFAAFYDSKGATDWPLWYEDSGELVAQGYGQGGHMRRMRKECYILVNGEPTGQHPDDNPFCFARRSSISYPGNFQHVPVKFAHSEADDLITIEHSYMLRDAIIATGPDVAPQMYVDTVVGPQCGGNTNDPGSYYHCYLDDPADVFDFLAPHVRNTSINHIEITTDESKPYYWLNIEQSGGEHFSTVEVTKNENTASVQVSVEDPNPIELGFNLGSASTTNLIAQPGMGLPATTYLVKEGSQNGTLVNYTSGYLRTQPVSTGQFNMTISALAVSVSANPVDKTPGQPLNTTITVEVRDGLGNAVPDGTAVTVTTSAGLFSNNSTATAGTTTGGSFTTGLALSVAEAGALVQATVGMATGSVTVGDGAISPTNTPLPSPTETATSIPPATPTPTATPVGNGCGPLVQEAEAGSLFGTFTVASDAAASSGQFVHTPDGVGHTTGGADPDDYASYCFSVSAPGVYRIAGWVYGTEKYSDSFWVRVNGAPAQGYLWDTLQNGSYQMDYVNNRNGADPLELTLAAGDHVVTVHLREDGTRLDKIALELVTPTGPTATPTFTPVAPNTPVASATVIDPTPTPAVSQTPSVEPSTTAPATGAPTATETVAPTQPPVATATSTAPATLTPTATMPPSTGCGPLVQEAEAGVLHGNFVMTGDSAASGGAYVHAPEGSGNRANAPDANQRVDYCFGVSMPGVYRIKSNVYGEHKYNDSFWVQVDGLPSNGYLWDSQQNTSYEADYVNTRNGADPVEIQLDAGDHVVSFYLREDGTRLDRVELELVLALPPSTPVASGCGPLEQEAEDGLLYGDFSVGVDGAASNGRYVHVADGLGHQLPINNAHRAEYCFDVQTAGTYRLKGWVHGDGKYSDSFWVRVDGVPSAGYLWDVLQNTGYQADYANHRNGADPLEFALSAGEHTVEIFVREDGTRLDKLILEPVDGLNTFHTQEEDTGSAALAQGIQGMVSLYNEESALYSYTDLPVDGVSVTLEDAATLGATYRETVQTNAYGRFFFDAMPAGDYYVTLTPPSNFTLTQQIGFAITAEANTSVTIGFELAPSVELPQPTPGPDLNERVFLPLIK